MLLPMDNVYYPIEDSQRLSMIDPSHTEYVDLLKWRDSIVDKLLNFQVKQSKQSQAKNSESVATRASKPEHVEPAVK